MVALGLYLALFWSVFNFTSAMMGGLYVVGDLGGSPFIAGYNVTFFGLGGACTFVLSSHLRRRFGALTALRFGIVLFCCTLALSSFVSTFPLFLFMHFLSGAASGPFFPLSVFLLEKNLSDRMKPLSFPILASLTTVAPVFGACFGGWVAYIYQWENIFLWQLPCQFLTLFFLKGGRQDPPSECPPFDKVGYITYLLVMGSLTLALCLGQELDWLRSPLIVSFLVLFALTLPFFLLWQRQHPHPLFDLSLFKIPMFSLSVVLLIFLFSSYFGMIILLSLWLHLEANYTPLWISLLLLHMILAGGLLFFFLKDWMGRVSPQASVLLALFFFAVSCLYSSTFNVETNFGRLSVARVLAGFGLAFFLFPLFSLCLSALSPSQKEQGVCLFQSCRLMAGALGVSVYTTLWYRRKVFYHERLDGSSLVPDSPAMDEFLATWGRTPKGYSLLEEALSKQATALALADIFYLMGWIMFCLLFLSLFLLLFSHLKKRFQRV